MHSYGYLLDSGCSREEQRVSQDGGDNGNRNGDTGKTWCGIMVGFIAGGISASVGPCRSRPPTVP